MMATKMDSTLPLEGWVEEVVAAISGEKLGGYLGAGEKIWLSPKVISGSWSVRAALLRVATPARDPCFAWDI